MNYHSGANRFTTSLPRDRALAILIEIDEAERMMWTERVRGPKASMVIHQIMMEASACLSLARETRGEAANIACCSGSMAPFGSMIPGAARYDARTL